MPETLKGTVTRIAFESQHKDFSVFDVSSSPFDTCTVVSKFAAPRLGEEVELLGDWKEHPKFGRQFQAAQYCRRIPSTIEGIQSFLASGAVQGIGPVLAKRLLVRFGDQVLQVIEKEPSRLQEVEGIGKTKAAAITSSYSAIADLRQLMIFLEGYGISGTYAAKLSKRYGADAVAVLQENPYRLAEDVHGIGFKKADSIAQSMGLAQDHPARLAAGLLFTLREATGIGNCFLEKEHLLGQASLLLGVDTQLIEQQVEPLVKSKQVVIQPFDNQEMVYPTSLYRAERYVAARLASLAQSPPIDSAVSNVPDWVKDWEQREGLSLAPEQRTAVTTSLGSNVLVLTGGPGTGKTSTIRCILDLFDHAGLCVLLAAPTGRAAKRMAEATGREATTIHRLLGYGRQDGSWGFQADEETPLACDALILDEVSMMDLPLMASCLRAVAPGTRVILVGDQDQLPSVGPGSVLRDTIESECVPVVKLQHVFRQQGVSVIVTNAHRINHGQMPETRTSPDFQFLDCETCEDVRDRIVRICQSISALGFDPLRDVQVLAPMYRLACGVEGLNTALQESLNPARPLDVLFHGLFQKFRIGDKVMQLRNNYDKGVFNGDCGFVKDIEDGYLVIDFGDQEVIYQRGETDQIQLSYAISVHKSQGSEYPVVILPLVTAHYMMLQRNLLYTAITRAKKRVILVGSRKALGMAIRNNKTQQRNTLLGCRLVAESYQK